MTNNAHKILFLDFFDICQLLNAPATLEGGNIEKSLMVMAAA
jgi:hypothetical protein